ncbi:hypothetical protein PHMEG_00024505 [Phytophthora megakarya]|uniref:Bzip transcription factor n=1 Tax=Phytophthora megakarya TaxID=4795 RepID=A0A225VDY4_9STRA|nr:hypothetical protein PHMEG_00024505 [Phytophthora megakarya]
MGQRLPAVSSAVGTAKLEFRRRRGRVHQARHRHKKLKEVQQVEDTLENLREEIHQLNMRKQVASLYLSMDSTALGIVVEYFRLFRFGVQQDVPTSKDMLGKAEAMVQRSFLKTAMAADVTDGTMVGASALLASWKFMSQCLENIDMLPIRIENGPEGVLNATAKCNFTITENTLRLAFPHLIDNGIADILAEKLIGKSLTMDGTYHFKYDEQSGRITCIQMTPDIVTPLLRLLGNLEDVARMFDNAVITPECKVAMNRVAFCS